MVTGKNKACVDFIFKIYKNLHFCWMKPNRNVDIHVLETHETLPKYMSRARGANVRHSDWLKSALRIAQNSWDTHADCSDFDKTCLYYPLIHPPHDYVSSCQIV